MPFLKIKVIKQSYLLRISVSKIFVAGHNGMVGSAITRKLLAEGKSVISRTRAELDLTNQSDVIDFFKKNDISEVYLCAARVGGIYANNTFPADFIYQNVIIQSNIRNTAYECGVKKLLFLGSSCIYPKYAEQPMPESALLTGVLEPTNEPYAIAKIAGIKMCESYNRQHGVDYRSVMPTNLYGPGDNYHPEHSHVIPALIRRFHEAKINHHDEVVVWGSGKALREFLYVDDMADASIFVMSLAKETYHSKVKPQLSHINVGSGLDCSISKLAKTVAKVIGFEGKISQDKSKPDGAPRKLMDSKLLNQMGWAPKYSLSEGLLESYKDFLNKN